MGTQFEKFVSRDNFILAYTRLKTIKRNEYKDFFYKDFLAFETYLQDNISELIYSIKEGIYTPTKCYKYYMPKKKNLARPISMLSLIDQIVYQAIINVIADEVYDKMYQYFNVNTFGNIFTKSESDSEMFFYVGWKEQWKKFNDKQREFYNKGYEYVVEFDIASFYDCIDHKILCEVLRSYEIEEELITLLASCLVQWSIAIDGRFKYLKSVGIPQGPSASIFLSEAYLFAVDDIMRQLRTINMKYFRYADDIRIMTKSKLDGEKAVVYLDLLSRDFSLIPQSEKIEILHIDNINKHLNNVTTKFSKIANEQKRNLVLLEGTHNKLKKQFISCFDTENANYMDKTIISFALFKLNADDEIRKIIIENINNLSLFYKGIIYYFNIHYPTDEEFREWINNYLLGDDVLYQYNKSIIFKNLSSLGFDERIFEYNNRSSNRFWIVKYQLIQWLSLNKKYELISQVTDDGNYYIQREMLYVKYELFKDTIAKKQFLKSYINSEDILLSLHALHIWIKNYYTVPRIQGKNNYIKRIIQEDEIDYIGYIFTNEFGVEDWQDFLNECKKDEERYKEMREDIMLFINNREINPSLALMSLNLFNNVVFDILALKLGLNISESYGADISQLANVLPLTSLGFKLINDERNQATLAHYKNKNKQVRIKVNRNELKVILERFNLQQVYQEICDYYIETSRSLNLA